VTAGGLEGNVKTSFTTQRTRPPLRGVRVSAGGLTRAAECTEARHASCFGMPAAVTHSCNSPWGVPLPPPPTQVGLKDADAKARETARKNLRLFAARWTDRGRLLWSKLDPTAQKQLKGISPLPADHLLALSFEEGACTASSSPQAGGGGGGGAGVGANKPKPRPATAGAKTTGVLGGLNKVCPNMLLGLGWGCFNTLLGLGWVRF
jgi:hypothetical protein